MSVDVKVVPGASRTRIVGLLGETLKLAVAAPPAGGAANEAVRELLAQTLRVPAAAVRIARGHARPRKTVQIAGLDEPTLRQRLAEALPP